MLHLSIFLVFIGYLSKSCTSGYDVFFCWQWSNVALWNWIADIMHCSVIFFVRFLSFIWSIFCFVILLLVCSLFFKSQIQPPVVSWNLDTNKYFNSNAKKKKTIHFTNQLDRNIQCEVLLCLGNHLKCIDCQ